jgi:glycosyltransferase involved in cell wall biosynthesis
MRNVLIIANLLHASPRIPGLAKYLPEFGWKPIVISGSAAEGTFGREFDVVLTHFPNVIDLWKKRLHLDPGKGFQGQVGIPLAVREKPGSITTRIVNGAKTFLAYPDEHKGWKRFAIEAADEVFKRERVEAIISSSSPFTAHSIARCLKVKHKVSWLADLRDLWSQNHNYYYGKIRKEIDKWFELKGLKRADALITVSPLWAEQLRELHRRDFVHSITNGFDPEQINKGFELTTQFTVTYTGCVYEGKQDFNIFFSAVRELISDGEIKPEDLRIRFYGPPSEIVDREIRRLKIQELVRQYGPIDRVDAFNRQRESQLLLIFYWNDPLIKGWYPLKSFEYLAAQRPIIVVGGSGGDVVEKLMNETNAGKCCRTKGDVKEALRSAYLEFKRNGKVPYEGNRDRIDKYSYREMARNFSKILDQTT